MESWHVVGVQDFQERRGLGEVLSDCPGENVLLFPLRIWITGPPPGPSTNPMLGRRWNTCSEWQWQQSP